MRPIALVLATILVVGFGIAGPSDAQDIEIEEAPADEDLSDLGARPRGPQAPEVLYGAEGFYGIFAGTYGAEDFSDLKNDIEDVLVDCAVFDNTLGFNARVGDRWLHNMAT
jgi:hypothetical protein